MSTTERDAEALTTNQQDELRIALQRRRADLAHSIDDRREAEERDRARNEGGDETTEGAASATSRLQERDVTLLHEIDHALGKFAAGTYGVCEATGRPIGYPRLNLRPWTRFSLEHEESLEREGRG